MNDELKGEAMSSVIDRILYTAEATVEGGREGHPRTSDGRLDVDLDVPSEMGGPGGPGTNREQLFAAGYAACFQPSRFHPAQSAPSRSHRVARDCAGRHRPGARRRLRARSRA